MIKIKNFLWVLLVPTLFFQLNLPVNAQETKEWEGSEAFKTSSGQPCAIDEVATIQGFECLFYNILQVIVFFAGIASFIMIIVGGFQYIFSHNDPKKTAVASSTLTMAVIGIAGVIASWLIISLIQQITGVNVTEFKIPGWQ